MDATNYYFVTSFKGKSSRGRLSGAAGFVRGFSAKDSLLELAQCIHTYFNTLIRFVG